MSPEEMPKFPFQGSGLENRLDQAVTSKVSMSMREPATTQKMMPKEELEARMENPEKTYADQNIEYVNIANDIPSKMSFYPGNSLCIRTFKTQHITKLIEAVEMEDFSMVVDTVSSVLEPGFSAYLLTPDDFFYCLYWLKLNSFKKSPMEISFTCKSKDHIDSVLAGNKEKETLKNKVIINKIGSLSVDYMTEEKRNKATEIIVRVREQYNVDLFPMQVKDMVSMEDYTKRVSAYEDRITLLKANGVIESQELEKITQDKNALEAQYALKDYAAHILLPGHTLLQKIDFLNKSDFDPDFFFEIDEFIEATQHGVKETAACRCQECNAEVDVPVSIDALHFFPETVRKRFANTFV